MNTQQIIAELDNLLAKLSEDVELGDTKAISEYHKILKTKSELLDLKPLPSERLKKQVDIEVIRFLETFVSVIEKDNELPNSSKKRIGEIATNICNRIALERSLIDGCSEL